MTGVQTCALPISAANKTVSVYQSVAGEPTENDFGFVVKMVLPMLSSLVLFMLMFFQLMFLPAESITANSSLRLDVVRAYMCHKLCGLFNIA